MDRLRFVLALLLVTGCGADEASAPTALAGEPCSEPVDAGDDGEAVVSAPPGPEIPPKDGGPVIELPDATAAQADGG